jgi:PIN domain nuclease of toxin-antitoxin system
VSLLLDTLSLLWFLDDDLLLSTNAKLLIEDPSNRKFVSIATCWEIAIKVGLGKLDLGESATTFYPANLPLITSICLGSNFAMHSLLKRCRHIIATHLTAF